MAIVIDPISITATAAEKAEALKIPAELQSLIDFATTYWWAFVLLMVWSAVWKGLSLYRAGTNKSPAWFTVLFLVNTLGILEIIYLFGPGKKKK